LDATDHVRRSSAAAAAGASSTASGRRDSAIRALAESILVACPARYSFAFSSSSESGDAADGAADAAGSARGSNHGGARRSSVSSFAFSARGSSSSSGGRGSAPSACPRRSSASSFAFSALAASSPRPSDDNLFTIAEAQIESLPAVQDPFSQAAAKTSDGQLSDGQPSDGQAAGSLGNAGGCVEAAERSAADGSLPPDLSGLSNGELLLVAASRIALLTSSLSESRTINEELMRARDAALSLLMDTQRKLTEASTRAVLSMPRVDSSCDLAALGAPSSPVATSASPSAAAPSVASPMAQKPKIYLDDDDDDYDESDDECDVPRWPVAPAARSPHATPSPSTPSPALAPLAEARSAESEEAEYARFLERKVAELQGALSQAEGALESARAEREAWAEGQERAVAAAVADTAASAERARAREVELMVALRGVEGQLVTERRRHVAEVDSLKEALAGAQREKEGLLTSLEEMGRALEEQREERDAVVGRLEAEKVEMVGELMDVIVAAVTVAGGLGVLGDVGGVGPVSVLLGAAAVLEPVLVDAASVSVASADVAMAGDVAVVGDVADGGTTAAEVALEGGSYGGWEEVQPEAAVEGGETLIATSEADTTVATAATDVTLGTAVATVTAAAARDRVSSTRRYSTAAGDGRGKGRSRGRAGESVSSSRSGRVSEGAWGKGGDSEGRIPKGKGRVLRDRDLPTRRHTMAPCAIPLSSLPLHLHPSHCRPSLPSLLLIGREPGEGRRGEENQEQREGGRVGQGEGEGVGQLTRGGAEGRDPREEVGYGESERYDWQAFRALIDGGAVAGGAMEGDSSEAGAVQRSDRSAAGARFGGDSIEGDTTESDTTEVDVMERRGRMGAWRRRWWDRGVMERVRAWEWRGGRESGTGREGRRSDAGTGEQRQADRREGEQRGGEEREGGQGGSRGMSVGEPVGGEPVVGEPGSGPGREPGWGGSYRRSAQVRSEHMWDERWSEHALGRVVVEGEEERGQLGVMGMFDGDKENVEPGMV
ncbi:hypothetical protein CLOM_g24446, partial [Closterium sp. NIES-68]